MRRKWQMESRSCMMFAIIMHKTHFQCWWLQQSFHVCIAVLILLRRNFVYLLELYEHMMKNVDIRYTTAKVKSIFPPTFTCFWIVINLLFMALDICWEDDGEKRELLLAKLCNIFSSIINLIFHASSKSYSI